MQTHTISGPSGVWLYGPPILFACVGIGSLLLTEVLLGVGTRMLWTWPVIVSCSVPPMLASWWATHAWLKRGNRFLAGWLSIAIAAWLSLLVNPIIWLLVLSTFMLFGAVVLVVFLATGGCLAVIWVLQGNASAARGSQP